MAVTEVDVAGSAADDEEMSDEDEDSEADDDDDDNDEVDDAMRERVKSALGDAASHSDIEVLLFL